MTIDIQGQQGYYGGYDRGNQGGPQLPPTQRVVRFEDTSRQYTQVRQIIVMIHIMLLLIMITIIVKIMINMTVIMMINMTVIMTLMIMKKFCVQYIF